MSDDMVLEEIRDKYDIRFARMFFEYYHSYPMPPGGGLAPGSRWFFGKVNGYIVAVAWIHLPGMFKPLFEKYGLDVNNSYFIRRVTSTAPGHYLVRFLQLLFEKLAAEGKYAVVTLATSRHSGGVYKKAGMVRIGKTARHGFIVYVKYLRPLREAGGRDGGE